MKTVFLGDSITAGENNNDTSFVDYFLGTTYNLGISGTTIGEYSIYPVDGNSLLSLINRHRLLIEKADVIFIEYGINDVASVMCGFVTEQTVIISFIKALDAIKQINSKARIIFLTISNALTIQQKDLISSYGKLQCDYLENVYFKNFRFNFPESVWVLTYISIIKGIQKTGIEMVSIYDDRFVNEFLSDDFIHPNNNGHLQIAKTLESIFRA